MYSDVMPCPIADHDLVTAVINLRKPKRATTVTKITRHMFNYSPPAFCSSLNNVTNVLTVIFRTDNVDKQVNIFTNIFKSCLNACAPFITKN